MYTGYPSAAAVAGDALAAGFSGLLADWLAGWLVQLYDVYGEEGMMIILYYDVRFKLLSSSSIYRRRRGTTKMMQDSSGILM